MNGRVLGVLWIAVLLALLAFASGAPERIAVVLGWTVIAVFRYWRTQKKVKASKG